MSMPLRVLITGGAGYVGRMLVERCLRDSRVDQVCVIDTSACPDNLESKNLLWIRANLADTNWQGKAAAFTPQVVIHTAFRIRQAYGSKFIEQERSNIQGSKNIFDFCFQQPVKKLIYFSSVSAYGAFRTNSLSYRFNEEDPLRETRFAYGAHKRFVEDQLRVLWLQEKKKAERAGSVSSLPQVIVVRPASISGPRTQEGKGRSGLLGMLGHSFPVIFVARPDLVRQFVHEDDIEDATVFLALDSVPGEYEVFNLAPDDYLVSREMARLLGKFRVVLPRTLVKAGFGALWHFTRGRIPTPPEGVYSYAFPILVDGSKITRIGFRYRYRSPDSLLAAVGRYNRIKANNSL